MEETPANLFPGKNTERAISTDKRPIADLRRGDIGFRKHDYYTGRMPAIQDILTEIVRSKQKYTTMAVQIRKRDWGGSFTLIYFHPCLSSVLATEFESSDGGMNNDISVSH